MTVSSSSLSWASHKQRAKEFYQQNDYEQALESYRAALEHSPESEQQLLLSNIVACRLSIGGPVMATAAVQEAKRCISLNDRWAKGHVRLASSYIAMGGHSNDACRALQRALTLDPSNPVARQMLTKELRRDRVPPAPSAPLEHLDDSRNNATSRDASSSSRTMGSSTTSHNNTRSNNNSHHVPQPVDDDLDDSPSWSQRLEHFQTKLVIWYHEQSSIVQTLLKMGAVVVVLYILMGGRFGFGASSSRTRGNYGYGNAYDRFRSGGGGSSSNSYGQNNRRTSSYDGRRNDYNDDYHYNSQSTRHQSRSMNLFDGSVPSMLLIGGVLYLCHVVGINPMQALFMLNMMNGGRRRGFGGGGGMFRPRYGGGRRGGMWY